MMALGQGIVIRRELKSLGLSVAILVVAALVGVYTLRDEGTGLVIATAALVASIVLVDGGRRDLFVKHGWIPYAWVALALVTDFRFTFRSTLDNSVSAATLENFIQVGVYGLVAALVVRTRRVLVTADPRPIRKGPLLAWPLLALISTIWSPIPLFTLVRSLQLLVPIGLATVMVRVWLSSPDLAASLWRDTLRFFVGAVTFLTLLGFATGFATGSLIGTRFAWPGSHPGVVATYCATALLILVAAGRSYLGVRLSGFVFRLLLFASAIYLSQTRALIGALAAAMAVLIWGIGRTKPASRYIGSFYYVIAVALAVLAAREPILEYLARGATLRANLSLTGRIPLWEAAVSLIGDADRWLNGFGYGAARVILPLQAEWAGTAHSAWLELLLSIGVLGPLLLAASLVFLIRNLTRWRSMVDPHLSLSIIVLLLVTSVTGETFVFPGVGFVMLALLYAPVMAHRSSPPWEHVDRGATPHSAAFRGRTVAVVVGRR
jgi:hypothetical protein